MTAYAKIQVVFSKYKPKIKIVKMRKNASHPSRDIVLFSKEGLLAMVMVFALVFATVGSSLVSADKFDEKIKALARENNKTASARNELGAEADNLSDQIGKLQDQIDAKQAAINQHQEEVDKLKVEIEKAQKELDRQKEVLGESIRAMYLEGDISTLEMLATSKNLSDYFDKQQYRESVQNKIKSTLDKITQLKLDLNTKKTKTEDLIAEQKDLKEELVGQRSEKDRLLSLNEGQQSELNQDIKANNARIAKLRQQQAIENARHFSGVTVIAGHNGRDSYPDAWRNAPQDSRLDSWGMYNRECVSYTAWKVYESGRFMPYWGGRGNANRWDDNARAAGIPVSSTPRAGDVAIAHWGAFGHAMYVESVNGDGTINISQYNWDYNGTYSEAYHFSTSGLVFIHFR